MQGNLKLLERTLKNDLGGAGYTFEESDWAEGFVIRNSGGVAEYTVYICPFGYSAYEAVGDPWKGNDLEDERAIILACPSVQTTVARIKGEMIARGRVYFPRIKELYEGYA